MAKKILKLGTENIIPITRADAVYMPGTSNTLVSALAGKSDISHTHTADEVGARSNTWVPNWNDVTNKPSTFAPILGETSTTAYRGDRGKIAYDHSQAAHAPVDAQKNSHITKAEIEAKLTGDVTTHNHDNRYYTETEIDGKIEDINEVINGEVAEITGALEVLNGNKLDTSVAAANFIQSTLFQEGEVYDSHTLIKGERIISPMVRFNTVIDDDGTQLTAYLSYFDTSINTLLTSIGNGDELLTDAKDNMVACINELQTEINNLNNELDTKIDDITEDELNAIFTAVGI